jgi:preprotein translocase subunit SecD
VVNKRGGDMKRVIILTLMMMLSTVAVASKSGMKVLETGMEGPFYGFYLGQDLRGHVKTKICKDDNNCKEHSIKITSDIRATLDGEEVSLSQFVMSKHQPAVLHFSTDTHKLVRITWISKR